MVGLQPPQRRLGGLNDVRRRAAHRAVAHLAAELGGQHHAVAAALQQLAQQPLAAAAVAVDVGGVEEVDAGVERGVDDPAGGGQVETAAEVVAAEPDTGDAQGAEVGVLHRQACYRPRGAAAV